MGGFETLGGGLAGGAAVTGGDVAGTVGRGGVSTGGLKLGEIAPGLLGSAGNGGLATDGGVAPVLLGGRNVLAGACPASGKKGPNRRGAWALGVKSTSMPGYIYQD